jgi:polyferredoxin
MIDYYIHDVVAEFGHTWPSYYILGAIVAFIHTWPLCSKETSVIPIVLGAMFWPFAVPLSPFFWIYNWCTKPRFERDMARAMAQYKKQLPYAYSLLANRKVHDELDRLKKEGRI